MNVIARLEYELAYYDSAVHRFNHYTDASLALLQVFLRNKQVTDPVEPLRPPTLISQSESGDNLQSSVLRCGTRPNEWGTQWDRAKEECCKSREHFDCQFTDLLGHRVPFTFSYYLFSSISPFYIFLPLFFCFFFSFSFFFMFSLFSFLYFV